jgi:hypothetical protein
MARNRADLGAAAAVKGETLCFVTGKSVRVLLEEAIDQMIERLPPADRRRFNRALAARVQSRDE